MQHVATMKAITILCSLFSLIFIVSAGRWSDWQAFGPCTSIQQQHNNDLKAANLQEGTQTRSRFCLEDDYEYAPDEDGISPGNCVAGVKETEGRACRLSTVWSKLSKPGECSVTCGAGKRMIRLNCTLNTDPLPDEDKKDMCELGKQEIIFQNCRKPACAENGGWSEWSNWGACGSADCHFPSPTNIAGLSYQIRSCSNPIPRNGGKMCEGPFIKIGKCFDPVNCPVDGGWGDWTLWGNWDCKLGTRNRTRVCDKPASRNGGRKCEGNTITFYDKIQNPESFDKACGIVTTTEKPTEKPISSEEEDEEEDYNNAI